MDARAETIFKRENGDKVKVEATIYISAFRPPTYDVAVAVCEKGKRTWKYKDCTDEYQYRQLPFNSIEREQYKRNYLRQFVSDEEIYQAKLALWEKLKP